MQEHFISQFPSNYASSVFYMAVHERKNKTKKTGKWKREDRDKRENVIACVTKYGEREQLGGHDNYGLIYDSVSVKLGFTGCHRDTFWKSLQSHSSIISNVIAHNFSSVEADADHRPEEWKICICKHGSILNSLHAQVLSIVCALFEGYMWQHTSDRCDRERLN